MVKREVEGRRVSDVWRYLAARYPGTEVSRHEGLEVDIDLYVMEVDIRHHGPEARYRPYIHAFGEVRAVSGRDGEVLPEQVSAVTYAPGRGDGVDVLYELTDAQLVDWAQKGYFSPGFELDAKELTDIMWSLPTTADMTVIVPESEVDAPVVFIGLPERGGLETGMDHSGYDLSGYTTPVLTQAEVTEPVYEAQAEAAQPSLEGEAEPGRASSEIKWADVGDEVEEEVIAPPEETGVSALDEQLSAAERELQADREALRAYLAERGDTVEAVYRNRVVPHLSDREVAERLRERVADLSGGEGGQRELD